MKEQCIDNIIEYDDNYKLQLTSNSYKVYHFLFSYYFFFLSEKFKYNLTIFYLCIYQFVASYDRYIIFYKQKILIEFTILLVFK